MSLSSDNEYSPQGQSPQNQLTPWRQANQNILVNRFPEQQLLRERSRQYKRDHQQQSSNQFTLYKPIKIKQKVFKEINPIREHKHKKNIISLNREKFIKPKKILNRNSSLQQGVFKRQQEPMLQNTATNIERLTQRRTNLKSARSQHRQFKSHNSQQLFKLLLTNTFQPQAINLNDCITTTHNTTKSVTKRSFKEYLENTQKIDQTVLSVLRASSKKIFTSLTLKNILHPKDQISFQKITNKIGCGKIMINYH